MLILSEYEKKLLLKLARNEIKSQFGIEIDHVDVSDKLKEDKSGVFVTLRINSQLRGCVGYCFPVKSIEESVKSMAYSAAFGDNRFNQLTIDEIDDILIEITLLSSMEEVTEKDDIVIGRDGLYVQEGSHSGILLPVVAEEYSMSKDQFIEALMQKAGIRNVNSDITLYKFTADSFQEGL